jgi:repressor LexA
VDYYLQALEADGLIERTPRTPRGLRLAGLASGTFEVNLEGTITAGEPIELANGPDKQIQLTPDITDPRKDLFALRVQGDSMIEELVNDGDILIVERRAEVRRGRMAVVHLQERNEATLKRVYLEGDRVRLQPAHPTMQPLYAHAKDVQIQGQVVAIIRQC